MKKWLYVAIGYVVFFAVFWFSLGKEMNPFEAYFGTLALNAVYAGLAWVVLTKFLKK